MYISKYNRKYFFGIVGDTKNLKNGSSVMEDPCIVIILRSRVP